VHIKTLLYTKNKKELSPKDYDYGSDAEYGSDLLVEKTPIPASTAEGSSEQTAAAAAAENQTTPPPTSSTTTTTTTTTSASSNINNEAPTSSYVLRHGGDAGGDAIRSVTMASDGSMVVAANHAGRIFTWAPRATMVTG
jgi:Tfp pilus assembly protein FimT